LEIATEIYNLDLKVKIVDAVNDSAGGTAGPIELTSKTGLKSVVVKYRLDFDNTEYVMKEQRNFFSCIFIKLNLFILFHFQKISIFI
jgi:hypothetical protein